MVFAHLRAFGNKPEPIKIHVGATANRNKRLADAFFAVHITLDPGHFHAALLQKSMYASVSPDVYVYAPKGVELESHLALIAGYNNRSENPTSWKENVYTGTDYLAKMLREKWVHS